MRKKSGIIISLLMLIMLLMASPAFANSTVEVDNIIVDKTAPAKPTITLSGTEASGGYVLPTVTISGIQDGGNPPSGIKDLEYSLDGGATSTTVPGTSITGNQYSFQITASGTYSIAVRIIDNAGNVSNEWDDVDVKKDGIIVYSNSYTTLTYTAGEGGTIEGETVQTVGHGADGTPVKAVPNPGYHFVGWSDGVSTPERTDTNVQGNINVTAVFARNVVEDVEAPDVTSASVTLKWKPVDGAISYKISINPPTEAGVSEIHVTEPYTYDGDRITYAITNLKKNTKYTIGIRPVFTDGEGTPSETEVTTKDAYEVTYEINPVGAGTITVTGAPYEEGKTVTATATANAGYTFKNWTVNGEVKSTNPVYEFIMPAHDLHLIANFERNFDPILTVTKPVPGSAFSNLAIEKYKEKRAIVVSGTVREEGNRNVKVIARLVDVNDVVVTESFVVCEACQVAKDFDITIPIDTIDEGTYKIVVTAEESN